LKEAVSWQREGAQLTLQKIADLPGKS
jgi:hypothetical protein